MPSLINGFGTAYYGRRKERADGSYATTEFFVVLYFPLIPLRSWRVRPLGEPIESYSRQWFESHESSSQDYAVSREPLDSVQAVAVSIAALCKVLAVAAAILLFFVAVIHAVGLFFAAAELTSKLWSGGVDALMILGAIGLLYWILLSRRPRRYERLQPTL
jgi:hypothetical protein